MTTNVNTTAVVTDAVAAKMAELTALKAAAKAKMDERVALAKMEAEISLLTNVKFQDALVSQALREDTTTRLESLLQQCELVVDSNPIYSATMKQNRKWNPSRRYGLGNQMMLLSGLISGITYSVNEHSTMMLVLTGLSSDLNESFLNSLGNLPYYSKNYNDIVEGVQSNVDNLLNAMNLIENILGINIDKSVITQQNLDRQYDIAMVKAERVREEAALAVTMQQYIIT